MYMAPELIVGKPAVIQSDIYALGVVLYQLLAGDLSRPLTMDWPREIEESVLVDLLADCFAGNPSERFPTAQRLGEHLRSIKGSLATLERKRNIAKVMDRVGYTLLFALGVTIAIVGIVFAIWSAMTIRDAPNPVYMTLDVVVPFSLLILGGLAVWAARKRYKGGWMAIVGTLITFFGGLFLLFAGAAPKLRNVPGWSGIIVFLLLLCTLGVGLLRTGHKQHLRVSKSRKRIPNLSPKIPR